MWSLALITLVGLNGLLVHANPAPQFFQQTPAQDRKGKGHDVPAGPTYEINPNFGFRSYHQIRYEPMTVPFEYNDYQAPIPPVDFGIPVNSYSNSYSGGGDSYGGGGDTYGDQSSNVYRTDVNFGQPMNLPPNEFGARLAPYQRF